MSHLKRTGSYSRHAASTFKNYSRVCHPLPRVSSSSWTVRALTTWHRYSNSCTAARYMYPKSLSAPFSRLRNAFKYVLFLSLFLFFSPTLHLQASNNTMRQCITRSYIKWHSRFFVFRFVSWDNNKKSKTGERAVDRAREACSGSQTRRREQQLLDGFGDRQCRGLRGRSSRTRDEERTNTCSITGT